MLRLLKIASAPVIDHGDRVILDVKFAEGIAEQVARWDGPVECILWRGATTIPFPVEVERAALPWKLTTLPAGARLPDDIGAGFDLISAAGDMADVLHLAAPGRTPVVYAIEYTHKTRCDILALDETIGPLRRLRRRLWLEQQERRRVTAFRNAAAIQSNGYPAARAYAALTQDMHIFLDNRMTPDRYVTQAEQDARLARLAGDGPLRIVHSGRLDPMKGAQDLIPVAARLAAQGLSFTLDIFGDGSLRPQIEAQVAATGLTDRVRLHGNVDFATELVPWQRRNADIFLSCHRQGDPSCTYVESMGCGLPVVGYANEMWGPLSQDCGGGWAEPLGDVDALARRILTTPRARMAETAVAARAFARSHDFVSEFRGRMDHLARVATRHRVPLLQ